jgi:hypothetical protein
MALKLTKKPATATVTKEAKSKGTTVSEETTQQEVPEFAVETEKPEQLCEVGVDMSYTHNLGNYQSARVAVSLKVPCKHAEIDGVFDYAKGWVENKLESLVGELQES